MTNVGRFLGALILGVLFAGSASAQNFIQLPASGSGYYWYGDSFGHWGTPRLVYGMERAAARWAREQPNAPRLGFGNMSLKKGGFYKGHETHRTGRDCDVRPVRNDGQEAPTQITAGTYHRDLTTLAISYCRQATSAYQVLFNDRQVQGTTWSKGHHNHFHVSVDGDGVVANNGVTGAVSGALGAAEGVGFVGNLERRRRRTR